MNINRYNKTPMWTAALASLICGAVTHLFGLVNILHNYDDIIVQPRGYGTGVTSGRWLLTLLGDLFEKIGGNYNLPVINGLLFILLIACSSAILVSTLHISERKMAALIGMLFVVFPSALSTLVFRYTAAYYGFAILLSVLAPWVFHRCPYGLLLSSFCIACSLGIYQAYVPITIGLFVLLLIQQALEGNTDFRKLVRRGMLYCCSLLLGLLLYFILLKITLSLYGTELSDYQGVNEMGKISLQNFPALIRKAFFSFCMLPVQDYCGLASSRLIRIVYILLGGISISLIGYILIFRIRKISVAVLTLVLCLLFPIAVNFIVIMCPNSWIYTLMVYAFVLIGCVPIILFECLLQTKSNKSFTRKLLDKSISFLLAVLVGCYIYHTNINYTALYYANRQMENYLSSMVAQVRMTAGFNTEMDWAFIGEIEDPLLHSRWQDEMTYDGIVFTNQLLQNYSWNEWVRNYYGYSLPLVDSKDIAALAESEKVKTMPCWPNAGSIQIISDTVVIKCQESLEK